MARTKMVGVALAAAAVLAGTTAAPAQAETATHHCAALFEDPTLSRVCGLVLDVVCLTQPPTPICT